MAELLWRECVKWLVCCGVLPADHKCNWPSSQVIDLAQTLRDGVLLCQLLSTLSNGCMDMRDVTLRPQMSQFLCVRNIRNFLQTCQQVFQLSVSDLFEPNMLFECTNFGAVLHTLSVLSHSPKALATGIKGMV
jgi:guanine nucleotide exchange factor VAV